MHLIKRNFAFDNLLGYDSLLGDVIDMIDVRYKDKRSPVCNYDEKTESYSVEFDIPGVPKENIKVEILSDASISVVATNPKGRRYSFSYYIDNKIDRKNITAKLDNGVLCVTLPRLRVNNERYQVKVE